MRKPRSVYRQEWPEGQASSGDQRSPIRRANRLENLTRQIQSIISKHAEPLANSKDPIDRFVSDALEERLPPLGGVDLPRIIAESGVKSRSRLTAQVAVLHLWLADVIYPTRQIVSSSDSTSLGQAGGMEDCPTTCESRIFWLPVKGCDTSRSAGNREHQRDCFAGHDFDLIASTFASMAPSANRRQVFDDPKDVPQRVRAHLVQSSVADAKAPSQIDDLLHCRLFCGHSRAWTSIQLVGVHKESQRMRFVLFSGDEFDVDRLRSVARKAGEQVRQSAHLFTSVNLGWELLDDESI